MSWVRGLLATAAFHGAHAAILLSRNRVENRVTRYDALMISCSGVNWVPSIRDTRPMRSLSASVSSRSSAYAISGEHPRKI